MSSLYRIAVERRGTADYCALLFRGNRLVTDAYGYRPQIALRTVVEHARYLRRVGYLGEARS